MTVKQQRKQPGRPRVEEGAEDSRALLLAAAARVIAERGYRAATIDDIVAAAGLSKGTFYWHFKRKDDLLFALLEERIDRPLRELIDLLKSASAERDMAPEASERFNMLLAADPETVLLEHEYRLLAVREPKLRTRYRKRQAELRNALAEGLDARARQLGAPPFSTPTTQIATAYLGLSRGLALEKLIDPTSVPDELTGETVALVYQGLVARAKEGK
jgi:AcrR family transcriptional regulator